MKSHVLSPPAVGLRPVHRPAVAQAIRFVLDRFLLLPLGAAIALVWANASAESYFTVALTLSFPVNQIGMALFLGLITQEAVEAVMPGGALYTWRRWSMPIIAATGGVLGATFAYLAYVSFRYEHMLLQAWPVACAIDIAAGYYVLKLIGCRRHVLAFLLLLAFATDAAGVVALALWPAFTPAHLGAAALLVVAVSTAAVMRRLNVTNLWAYVFVCGTVAWSAFYWAGVPPALALVPIVPFMPHEPRRLNLFASPADDDAVHHAEHEWNAAAQVALFLFGLVNAGVLLRGYDEGTWAILVAALVGRPLGVLAAVGLAVAAGLALPGRIGWREIVVIAFATTSGFTFALFSASNLLAVGPVLAQIKVGALMTVAGALVTYGVARVLRVGRFAPPTNEAQ